MRVWDLRWVWHVLDRRLASFACLNLADFAARATACKRGCSHTRCIFVMFAVRPKQPALSGKSEVVRIYDV